VSKYDGRGKKAREWMNGEESGMYMELLKKVEGEVMSKGREMEVEVCKEREEKVEEGEKATAAVLVEPMSAVTEVEAELVEIDNIDHDHDHDSSSPPKNLRIGVSSEMGRDRSVAFVEELSRRKWPVEWAVEVLHRDVDRQRWLRKGKGKGRGGEKGGRRKTLRGGDFVNEE